MCLPPLFEECHTLLYERTRRSNVSLFEGQQPQEAETVADTLLIT